MLPSREISLQLIMVSVRTLIITVAGLIMVLLIMKAWRIWSRRRLERWTLALTPIFDGYLKDPSISPRTAFQPARRVPHILQYFLINRSFSATGATYARIVEAYVSLEFIERDLRRLRNPFWWVRAEGARCLGQMRHLPAKGVLLKALGDRILEVRLLSAWSLGRIGDPDVITPIIEALSGYSRLAGMRLSSTVFELGLKAVEPLIAVSGHPDPAVRLLVVQLLGELKDARALDTIVRMAAPAQPKFVRIAAFKALGNLEDGRAYEVLRDGLSDEAWEMRAQAAKALGRMRTVAAIPALVTGLTDRQWWVRRNSGEALAALGAQGRTALQDAFEKNSDRFARDMAAQWLDDLGIL